MEIRVLGAGSRTYSDTSPRVVNVVLDGSFDLVNADFSTEQDELDVLDHIQADLPERLEIMRKLGGTGRFTILERSGARIEVLGSVADLAPALRQIADAFEAKLREKLD